MKNQIVPKFRCCLVIASHDEKAMPSISPPPTRFSSSGSSTPLASPLHLSRRASARGPRLHLRRLRLAESSLDTLFDSAYMLRLERRADTFIVPTSPRSIRFSSRGSPAPLLTMTSLRAASATSSPLLPCYGSSGVLTSLAPRLHLCRRALGQGAYLHLRRL